MRPRRSLGGPLVLIAIGVLFLIHTISPDFEIVDIFSRFWPFALILWGVVQLIEIGIWAARGTPVPLQRNQRWWMVRRAADLLRGLRHVRISEARRVVARRGFSAQYRNARQ